MYETEDEVRDLQALLDRSHAAMGEHMASIFKPERRLSARQVCNYLLDVKHLALATVTARGEPRVGPIDAFFLHGRFYFGSAKTSARYRHLVKRPACSAVHMVGEEIGITVHGRAAMVTHGDPGHDLYVQESNRVYGTTGYSLGDVFVARLEPERMYTFASNPAKYPD